ncbi:hypothetical protein [Maribacter sp. 2308TA10-17]|uniref:hypothetical protein n=1 Tax=Maribacter sp. 2308TA10-17 TaxID=3386276 RepID=UPI0039BCD31D
MSKALLVIFLLFAAIMMGQDPPEPSPTVDEPKLTIDDFAYPRFMDKEEHASFMIRYQLTDNLQIELQSFYDTYLLSNRFRNSLALKRYLSKKLYLFAGVEVEIDFVKESKLLPKRPPRVGIISGMGYDVNRNFTIEAKSNIGLNQTSMGAFGEPFIAMPQVYTLGGKIKF